MSAPRSSATWTASSTSSSVPASSPGERVARPAAAIKRRAVLDVGQPGIGAERGKRLHQLGVGGQRREEERRGAELVGARVVQVHLLRHPRVQVGAVRDQLLHELEAAQRARSLRRRIVVADAGLAHGSDGVQHRVAGDVGVRIRAGVEQLRCQLEMRIGDGEQQRRGRRPAAGVRRSHAGAGRRSVPSR